MLILFILVLLALLWHASVFFGHIANYRKTPRVEKDLFKTAPESRPLVSIIVPARNEETNIVLLIDSILAQDYPHFELIVVNDHSTDRTAERVGDFSRKHANIRLINSGPLPQGWTGRNSAFHQGVNQARGEYLLFMDADTRLDPECLTQSLSYMIANGLDYLSLFPRLQMDTFWEKIVLPFIVVTVPFDMGAANDVSDKREATGCGPFQMCRREVYQAVGGHAAIRDVLSDDIALAKLIKRSGCRVLAGWGASVASARLYAGLGRVWYGVMRWCYLGFREYTKNHRRLALVIPLLVLLAWLFLSLPWLGVIMAAALYWQQWSPAWFLILMASLMQIAFIVLTGKFLKKHLKLEDFYLYFQPLGLTVFMSMLFFAGLKVALNQEMGWRGRKMDLSQYRAAID